MAKVTEMTGRPAFTAAATTQALHKGLSPEQSSLLQAAQVAIFGLGGLGSNVAMWLARLGVGQLLLYDFDRVELSNLNRQYYFVEDVGEYKAVALLKHLRAVNPYGDYQSKVVRLTEDNLAELVDTAPIICEALDKPETKALLVNGVLESFPDKFLVAASGLAGFGSSDSMQVRQITPHFYLCGDGSSSFLDLPLCGARVGLCAAQEALTIARIILQMEV